MDLQKIFDKIKEEKYSVVAIRRCCKDEKYNVGDICRNSYEWNYEYDVSSYDTETPIELDGTCGLNISNIIDCEDLTDAKEIINNGMEKSSIYDGNNVIIIAGHDYSYGNDEEEVIIENADVITVL